jgi:hypothetical protein
MEWEPWLVRGMGGLRELEWAEGLVLW